MVSQLKVNEIITQSGTSLTLGKSGDAVNLASGATAGFSNFVGQVVEDTEFSVTQTSSTSFVDVGVACIITPTSTSSKILIHAGVGEPDELDGRIRAHVFRGSQDLGSSADYGYRGSITAELGRNLGFSGTEDHFGTFSKSFIDSPATTDQITYSVKIASGTGSSIRIGNGTPSYVVAMEILQ